MSSNVGPINIQTNGKQTNKNALENHYLMAGEDNTEQQFGGHPVEPCPHCCQDIPHHG